MAPVVDFLQRKRSAALSDVTNHDPNRSRTSAHVGCSASQTWRFACVEWYIEKSVANAVAVVVRQRRQRVVSRSRLVDRGSDSCSRGCSALRVRWTAAEPAWAAADRAILLARTSVRAGDILKRNDPRDSAGRCICTGCAISLRRVAAKPPGSSSRPARCRARCYGDARNACPSASSHRTSRDCDLRPARCRSGPA